MEIEYNWFTVPPVHPEMKVFDNELAWKAVPAALKVTLDTLKKTDNFIPDPFNGSGKETKEEFFDYIEKMLDNGITQAGKSYRKDIYVIRDFPFSHVNLTIDGHLSGLGRVYLTSGVGWEEYKSEEDYNPIPKEVLKEFDLIYEYYPGSRNPHQIRINPDRDICIWYIKDVYNEQELFARNFAVAYTNEFLKSIGK